jgi:hypothetical protein
MRMRNRAALVLAALAVLGSAACSPDGQGAAGQSAPATVGSASADVPPAAGGTSVQPAFTENPDGTINRSGGPRPATSGSTVTAGGLGPYQVGVAVGELRAAGLVTRIAPIKGCAGYTGAIGAHRYHSPDLVFYQGRLLHLTVDSARVATDKGVQVGTRAANVRGRYPGGKQLDDWAGNSAWLAVQGDYALLFAMKNGKVTRVQAGMAEPLQFKFTDNQGC